MKILHINCSDKGSTGKIISEIYSVGKNQGYNSILCNPKRKQDSLDGKMKMFKTSFAKEQAVYKRLCYVYGYQYGFAPISTSRIIHIIEHEKPDVVHIHSINCYMVNIYKLFTYLAKHDYPTVITNHAEFFYTGNCSHAKECTGYLKECGSCSNRFEATRSIFRDTSHQAWVMMRNSIQRFKHLSVVSVSPWVLNRSEQSPIMRGKKQSVILNGVNTNVFHLYSTVQSNTDKRIILFVTANFNENDYAEKGGGYIVDLAKRFSGEDVEFWVIGKFHETTMLPDNVTMIGRIDDQEKLAHYYNMANLTLVVSRRETFSMPVAESLCCGTPVVGFEAGGPESIAEEQYSEFVPYGDTKLLEKIIRGKWLSFKNEITQHEISKSSVKKYDSNRMANEYLAVYKELLDEKNRDINLS